MNRRRFCDGLYRVQRSQINENAEILRSAANGRNRGRVLGPWSEDPRGCRGRRARPMQGLL